MNTDQIEKLLDLRNEALFAFIDKVAGLSTAALALTVTFRGAIADRASEHRWLLAVCWAGFAVAALFGTLLHLSKVFGYGKMVADLIDGASESTADGGWHFPILIVAMTLGFVCGIAALAAYGIIEIH